MVSAYWSWVVVVVKVAALTVVLGAMMSGLSELELNKHELL